MTDDAVLDAQRRLWSLGDYGSVAQHLWPLSEQLVVALGVRPDDDVLDVGVGDGNTALIAARAGARVTGIDLTPAQLELAGPRLAREGLAVDLREANAEDLPFRDGSFDVVASSVGLIFAPDHVKAVAEMARVLRPGGRAGITAWAGKGWSVRLWERAAHLLPAPAPGAPKPEGWGDPDTAIERFAAAGLDATAEIRPFAWEMPSVEEYAAFFEAAAGPFVALFAHAAGRGTADEVRTVLVATMREMNEATDGSCRLRAPFLLVTGRKR